MKLPNHSSNPEPVISRRYQRGKKLRKPASWGHYPGKKFNPDPDGVITPDHFLYPEPVGVKTPTVKVNPEPAWVFEPILDGVIGGVNETMTPTFATNPP